MYIFAVFRNSKMYIGCLIIFLSKNYSFFKFFKSFLCRNKKLDHLLYNCQKKIFFENKKINSTYDPLIEFTSKFFSKGFKVFFTLI